MLWSNLTYVYTAMCLIQPTFCGLYMKIVAVVFYATDLTRYYL